MPAPDIVQLPPNSTGQKIDCETLTVSSNTVLRQNIIVADPSTAGALSAVKNSAAVSSDYGLSVKSMEVNDVVAATTASWTNATSGNTSLSLAITNFSTVVISINTTTTMTQGVVTFEASDDGGTTWYGVRALRSNSSLLELTYSLTSPPASQLWQVACGGFTNFRARLSTVILGSGTATVRMQAISSVTPGPLVVHLDGITFTLSSLNSSSAQLAAGATFTGSIESTFNQPAAQLIVISDQPYTVNLDQFDGANNLVSTDTFTRLANAGLNENVQINGNFVRIRVTNTGSATTTTLRIETTYGPIPPLPRALTSLGNLKVSLQEANISDNAQFNVAAPTASTTAVVSGSPLPLQVDAQGRLKISTVDLEDKMSTIVAQNRVIIMMLLNLCSAMGMSLNGQDLSQELKT
jgi:hypothetical protein